MYNVRDFIKQWNISNKDLFYDAARTIWENPELSMNEVKSMEILVSLLKEHGFSVEKGVAGMPTAFIATYGSGEPVIGLNAEYDALPGLLQYLDTTHKEPIKTDAPGHGCGHNLLGTAGVKAAICVRYALEKYELPGTIKVIGAPAEELCIGKPYLGRFGYLQGYDAILDWHPWSYTKADYDSCSAYFSVKYHYTGKECHGNSPWHGRSALDGALLQIHGIEMLREHIYPGNPPDAANTINFTFCDTGAAFPSVIPNKTTLWCIGRFTTTGEAEDALQRITDCAKGAALSTGTSVETELITMTHHKIPSKTLAQLLHRNLTEIGAPSFTEGEHELAKSIQREMGAPEAGLSRGIEPFKSGYTVVCDTSEYSWNAPYAAPWIAMGPIGIGWHNWGVTRCSGDALGLKSMDKAAEVLSLSVVDLFTHTEILEEAAAEWQERMGGLEYKCLIPENNFKEIKKKWQID